MEYPTSVRIVRNTEVPGDLYGSRTYYAAYNMNISKSALCRKSHLGWRIARFSSREERDAFVARFQSMAARAVTRLQAETIWRDCYDNANGVAFADAARH